MANTDKSLSFYRKVCTYFTEFSNNTSIHGFKYFTENGRLVIEKLWWWVIFAVCFFVCGQYIANCSKKWETNPVFIGYGQTTKTFLDIPFPAITVCPENKIVQSRYNFTDYMTRRLNGEHLTSQEQKDLDDSLLVCHPPVYKIRNTADSKSIDFLIRNCPTLEDIFESCDIGGYSFCAKKISPLLTIHGLCYTFNMLDRTELFSKDFYMPEGFMENNKSTKWSFDEGYDRTKREVYPFRPKLWRNPVYLTLKTVQADIDLLCNNLKGFKIFVHHPAEIPGASLAVFLEIAHKTYTVFIKPSVVTTAPGLRSIDPHRRKCYFSNERRLKFFRIYTQRNCENECLANYTLERCGCSVLNMPREKSTRICNDRDWKCFLATEEEFLRHHIDIDVSTGAQGSCDCLPTCNLVSYEAEVTRNNIPNPNNNSAEVLQAKVEFTFKNRIFPSQERNELYSTTDFWADCGGLLSLFTGFSVISLVEIVYYLSLRWLCNIWKFGKNSWFGPTCTV